MIRALPRFPTNLDTDYSVSFSIVDNLLRTPPFCFPPTNSAAQLAKRVAQRPDHEPPFFSLLLQFTSRGGDLGSFCLDNVVR